MPRLSSISNEIGDEIVPVELVVTDKNGTTFNIAYLATAITGEVYDEFERLETEGTLTPAVAVRMVNGLVVKWDLIDDDDKDIPVNLKGFKKAGFGVLLLILRHIFEDIKPKKKN